MIILVKINQTYIPDTDPKIAAYKGWELGSLLDNQKKRNYFKYLIAYYSGEIVGTYCISGVSLDSIGENGYRKVKFLLKDTNTECDTQLKKAIDTIFHKIRKIQRGESFHPILDPNFSCGCSKENIPVLDSNQIYYEVENYRLPSNVWLKLSSIRTSYDSFSTPHTKKIETIIRYSPNGNIEYTQYKNTNLIKKTLNNNTLTIIRHILSVFYTNPTLAINEIDNSDILAHVAHHNGFELEFEVFSDEKFTKRLSHQKWNGNVLGVNGGFLKQIFKVMN